MNLKNIRKNNTNKIKDFRIGTFKNVCLTNVI